VRRLGGDDEYYEDKEEGALFASVRRRVERYSSKLVRLL